MPVDPYLGTQNITIFMNRPEKFLHQEPRHLLSDWSCMLGCMQWLHTVYAHTKGVTYWKAGMMTDADACFQCLHEYSSRREGMKPCGMMPSSTLLTMWPNS